MSTPKEKAYLVGLVAGSPGSGKDTLCKLLEEHYPGKVSNVKFADSLTAELGLVFHKVLYEDFLWLRNDTEGKDRPFSIFGVEQAGDAGYRKFLENQGHAPGVPRSIRWHLLKYGTEYIRQHLGRDDHWLQQGMADAMAVTAYGHCPVITDVRFPNEAKAIQETGGKLVYIANHWVNNPNGGLAEGLINPGQCDLIINNIRGNPTKLLEDFNARYSIETL